MPDDPLITVASYTDPLQAHIAGGRLESEGIPVTVLDEHLIWANWMLSNALGGVKLQIPASYVEQAKLILQEMEQGTYALEEPVSYHCPRCHSSNIHPQRTSWKLAILGLFILHLPIPFRRNRMKCNECGYSWSLPREETDPED